MNLHRSALPVIGTVGLLLGLLPGPLPGDARKPEPEPVVRSTPAHGDSIAVAFAARYGIDVELAEMIHRAAVKQGLEPAAVFGLIATESAFDSRAVGRAGSVGLMQIKPSTARAYDNRATRERLFNPEINLRVGMTHLRRELAHFRYDWTLGLLSYNMGRARLSRALANGVVPRNGYARKVLAHCGKVCS
ncbi:MAG: lytic transglycosylase domain-containing protein [Gemmatimonadota bacterium]